MMNFKQLITDLIDVSTTIKMSALSHDYSGMMSQVEKWQSLANKLESSLENLSDLDSIESDLKKASKEYKKARKQLEELKPKEEDKDA